MSNADHCELGDPTLQPAPAQLIKAVAKAASDEQGRLVDDGASRRATQASWSRSALSAAA